ncbi:MAG: FAD-dependent oxidoreductase [Silvanigrellaceae bacterium]
MKIVVVGKGILGLSIAEFFSRSGQVQVRVLSNAQRITASSAAAANLATKAQVFARDPHFELKIRGKKRYHDWLVRLRQEIGLANPEELSLVYHSAKGRDVFDDEESCSTQWRRVVQPPLEIIQRELESQSLFRVGETAIEYGDEAWIDARHILGLLEKVCRQRRVAFDECDATDLGGLKSNIGSCDHLILCAGAWTPGILSAWGLASEDRFFGKRRWSWGGTLEIETSGRKIPEGVSLFEVVSSSGEPGKITFSGSNQVLFCSSISVKLRDLGLASIPNQKETLEHVENQKIRMIEVAEQFLGKKIGDFRHHFHWGMRLGFGHGELLVENLSLPAMHSIVGKSLWVAAGAHKSGFLFAPCIGELVMQKMQAHKAGL